MNTTNLEAKVLLLEDTVHKLMLVCWQHSHAGKHAQELDELIDFFENQLNNTQ